MNSHILITRDNSDGYFYLEHLKPETQLADFSCPISEYSEYLIDDALRSLSDHVALTWLLRERSTDENFGVRVTEIVSPMERMNELG